MSSVQVAGPLSLRLEVPAVIAGGQSVPLRLVVTNISKDTVMIGRPDHEFFVTDYTVMHGSRVVWQKLRHRSCACAELSGPLAPSASLSFLDYWPQRNNHHWPVSPGRYTVTGTIDVDDLPGTPGSSEVGPVEFRVR
jgi:hypothetical protein